MSWASRVLRSAKWVVGSPADHMSAWMTIRTADAFAAFAAFAAAKPWSSQSRLAALRALYSAASPSICLPVASNCGALLSLPVTFIPRYVTGPYCQRTFSG
ncbi:hypothetical protein [Micromonospora sp. RTP1Z1]|uniref:hypothetical protein n=1 Tax=Micromonospora sp. RTP1Z1 TaxID=2994043 RepID=UPI0029C95E4C|nr:hypothetical protein [Micromonospora sp. RTP1Z1]